MSAKVWSCLRIVSVMGEGLYQFLHSWSASDNLLWYSICCTCWLYYTLSVLPVTVLSIWFCYCTLRRFCDTYQSVLAIALRKKYSI
jgi:hypothetical protein